MSISIIITSYNDTHYLMSLIDDVAKQDFDLSKVELILIEAGENNFKEVCKIISKTKISLNYFHRPKMSRINALNECFLLAKNDLIVRLDSRVHIENNYITSIFNLANNSDATVVGGLKVPIGKSKKQKLIAKIMSHPGLLGGAKARRSSYQGYADTVYLGAYKREVVQGKFEFDKIYEKMSEDADLNHRITKSGKKIYISGEIKVYYYPRETFFKFIKLMFGYGISSGLFVLKNRKIKLRQLILPLASLILILLFILSIYFPFFIFIILAATMFYLIAISFFAVSISRSNIIRFIQSFFCFLATHSMWTIGFYYSLFIFFKKN